MARRRALKTVQLLCGFSAQPACLLAIERSHQYQLASRLVPGAGYATVAPLPREQLSAAQGYGFAAAAIVQPPVATDSASDLYSIKVVTGNLRGAGTPSAAKVQLVGSISASEPVLIGTDELGTLDRGSTRTIAVPVPRAFGTLRRVHVEKAHPVAGDGWYLKHIEVSMPGGDTVLFPCDAWLGDSDCGGYNGPSERNLLPAVPSLSVEDPTPVQMVAAGVAIPHPEKVLKNKIKGHNTKGFGYGGEDAYYYVDNGKGLFSMGVADGVYQWREHGIDPGEMSRALMEVCSKQVLAGEEDVFKIFNRAVDHMHKVELKGSTTVCLISINQVTGQLHSVNLGDSGFLVFTPSHGMGYDLKFRTNQLEHSFGCPFQIGHHKAANKVSDSDLASFHLFPGDVIVMGSDGLLDNVTDLEMATEVADAMRQNASPSQIAHRLTKLAFDTSLDKKHVTPYSKGASEAFDMIYSGGKPDDITVLVAVAK